MGGTVFIRKGVERPSRSYLNGQQSYFHLSISHLSPCYVGVGGRPTLGRARGLKHARPYLTLPVESDYSTVVKCCLDVFLDVEIREDICIHVQMSPTIGANVPTFAPYHVPPVSMTGVDVLNALSVRLRVLTCNHLTRSNFCSHFTSLS